MQQALARCFAPATSLGFRYLERRQFGLDDCFVYRLMRSEHEAR